MEHPSTGLPRGKWSPALLDAFGSDARAAFDIGDDIPAHMAHAMQRELHMECNLYQANIYGYAFLRKDGEEPRRRR